MSSPFISSNKSSGRITVNGVSSSTGNLELPLSSLSDIDFSSLSDNEIIKYNSATGKWNNAILNVVSSLSSLSDVTLTNPSNYQVLRYNGSKWVNATLALQTNLSLIGDCQITMPDCYQTIQYDGARWVNTLIDHTLLTNIGTNSHSQIDTFISNFNISTPSNNQVLQYDNASSKWKNATLNLVTNISSLSDVTITSIADGNLLIYSSSASKWINSNTIYHL